MTIEEGLTLRSSQPNDVDAAYAQLQLATEIDDDAATNCICWAASAADVE